MKTIAFRADASVEIGTGHVMRCLTLADGLREQGAIVFFICREQPGNLMETVKKRGYRVVLLPDGGDDVESTIQVLRENTIDWLIVDHYQIDEAWEKQMRPFTGHIMVIDDLANRCHGCDVLLDQNYYEDEGRRYRGLIPAECKTFLGPKYLLLRSEFFEAGRRMESRDGTVRRLLVFYGGSDPTHETEKALGALNAMNLSGVHIDVVTGNANPNRNELRSLSHEIGASFHCQIDYLAKLVAGADLALGAGGVAMWERCYLGLPTLTTVVAENQRKSVRAAGEVGAVWPLGWHKDVTGAILTDALNEAFSSPGRLNKIGKRARRLMRSDIPRDVHPVVRFMMEGD